MGTARYMHQPFRQEARVTEFWSLVDTSAGVDGCWPWRGYAEKGYGRFRYRGGMRGAHELALSFTTGEARHPSLDTCHSCDNALCCNPAHLRFDTRQSNVDDMTGRSRHARGERNGRAELTEREVVIIRERHAAGAKQKDLASEYGLRPSAVSLIVRGKRWGHVGGPIARDHGNRKHGRYARERGEQ